MKKTRETIRTAPDEEWLAFINPVLPDRTGEIDRMVLEMSDVPVLLEKRQEYMDWVRARNKDHQKNSQQPPDEHN